MGYTSSIVSKQFISYISPTTAVGVCNSVKNVNTLKSHISSTAEVCYNIKNVNALKSYISLTDSVAVCYNVNNVNTLKSYISPTDTFKELP